MQSLVLDTSVTISALIEEAQSDEARDIFATIAADGEIGRASCRERVFVHV
jgi:hypothetical protein